MRAARRGVLGALALALATVMPAPAEVPMEIPGEVATTLDAPRPHWVWVHDILLRRSALVDADDGDFLGMVSTGFLSPTALFPRSRDEFYLPETYYSRGSRGERSDVVTIYDSTTLAPVDEVVIPAKRAVNVLPSGNAALSDDDRFLAVFNMNPATSLSIVDVSERRFVAEVQTPGCSLVYAAGDRRFFMLCANGELLAVELDETGQPGEPVRGARFFDPEADPVTEKAVRWGDTWVFVSFEGMAHPVDVAGEMPAPGTPWSLLSEGDRGRRWRIGGSQHLAVHQRTGRLFSLVHQGGVDTHKDPGTELWVYDLASRERIQRIELRHPGISFLSETVAFGESWVWPFNRVWDWMLDYAIPNPGLTLVQVTQDANPLLLTGSQYGGSIAVYEALSGRFLRRVSAGNLQSHVLIAPWGGPGAGP